MKSPLTILQRAWRTQRTFVVRASKEGIPQSLFANAAEMLAAAASGLLVVRFLDPVAFADLRVAQAYLGWVGIIAGVGLATPILKFCAGERKISGDKPVQGPRSQILGTVIRIGLLSSAGTVAIAVMLAAVGLLMGSLASRAWFYWLLATVPFSVSSSYCVAYLQAIRDLKPLAWSRTALRLGSVPMCLAAAAYGGTRGYVIALIVTSLLWAASLVRLIGFERLSGAIRPLPAGFRQMATQAVMGNLIWSIGRTADVALLDRLYPDRTGIAAYAVGQSIALIAVTLLGALQVVAVPYFSEMLADKASLQRRLIRNEIRLVLAAASCGLVGWTVALIATRFYLSPTYRNLPELALPLLGAVVIQSSAGLLSSALVACGRVDLNTRVTLLATLIGIAVCWISIRLGGLFGAAVGQTIAAAIWASMEWAFGWPALRKQQIAAQGS